MVYSAKKGWLSRTAFIEQKSAVPVGITEGTHDYSDLIGKIGKAASMLRPAGIAIIDGERYDVVSLNEYIPEGSEVVVSAVEGVRIVVKQVK
jgi:membrane-bound ClpP family serine protease